MSSMFFSKLLLCLLLSILAGPARGGFVFNGFTGSNLTLSGLATVTPTGLLELTNRTAQKLGHAFYPTTFRFRGPSSSPPGAVSSFSATYVFAIASEYPRLSGHGIAFVVSPAPELPQALPSQYMGLFGTANNGNRTNRVLAVELDTILSSEFGDIDNNHVGIDVNSLRSNASRTAAYYSGIGFTNLSLISGDPMLVWVEYDGKEMNVTLSPINVPKPSVPLLSVSLDLSDVFLDDMYVGFSSSTGSVLTSHYILGWSFQIGGRAPDIDLSRLPALPRRPSSRNRYKAMATWMPLATALSVLLVFSAIVYVVRRRIKFAEVVEDWEIEYGPRRFKYKDLYKAAKGFKEKQLLGSGGFGRVYHGVLPSTKAEVAIKKVSHESRQGMKEFVTEVVSMGQLRHRNLVQLLGYCRRKGELLLVYDFMPNGSLDKFLFGGGGGEKQTTVLRWEQRFQIIKGVASGLLYLHSDWEKVVVHRDVKASNVLLDADMNGRLGDFGLARLYDHGADPQTTRVVGTMGYMAPELTRTSRSTTATDVFAFGAFVLEVACGRRPIQLQSAAGDELVLVDWVAECWRRGKLLEASDPKLGGDYEALDMELVLKLGLLCSHPTPKSRPTMRQVVQFLDGAIPLPELTVNFFELSISEALKGLYGFDEFIVSVSSSSVATNTFTGLSGGR